MIALLLTFLTWFSEPVLVARIDMYLDNGNIYYTVSGNPQVFADECHLLTYLSIEAIDRCGIEKMEYYKKVIYQQDSIARTQNGFKTL